MQTGIEWIAAFTDKGRRQVRSRQLRAPYQSRGPIATGDYAEDDDSLFLAWAELLFFERYRNIRRRGRLRLRFILGAGRNRTQLRFGARPKVAGPVHFGLAAHETARRGRLGTSFVERETSLARTVGGAQHSIARRVIQRLQAARRLSDAGYHENRVTTTVGTTRVGAPALGRFRALPEGV